MKSLLLNGTLAVLSLILFGCAAPKPQKTSAPVTTYSAPQRIDIKLGMKASEVINLVGIPAGATTAKAIDEGANMTLIHGGHSYVFSGGVLQ